MESTCSTGNGMPCQFASGSMVLQQLDRSHGQQGSALAKGEPWLKSSQPAHVVPDNQSPHSTRKWSTVMVVMISAKQHITSTVEVHDGAFKHLNQNLEAAVLEVEMFTTRSQTLNHH